MSNSLEQLGAVIKRVIEETPLTSSATIADSLTYCLDELIVLRGQNTELQKTITDTREAWKEVAPYVVTQLVACNGLKCGELVCGSCDLDAEKNVEIAREKYAKAYAVIMKNP